MPLQRRSSPAARVFRTVLLCLPVALAVLAAPLAAQDQTEPSRWYAVESGDAATATPDRPADMSTPRAAVRNFIAAARDDDFDRAAQFLNLARIAPQQRDERGPELAEQLSSVIERRVWIDWSDLPARPDAMIETPRDHPLTGKVRRDLGLVSLEAEGTAHDIRIARYRADGRTPVWLFTPQTVASVPVLYQTYGPRRFETSFPEEWTRVAGGLRIWEWMALPVFAGLVILSGWIAARVVRALSGLASRSWLRRGLRRSAMPLALLAGALAAQLMLSMAVSFSGPITAMVRPALLIVMVWGLGMAMLRVVDALLNRVTHRFVGDIDDTRAADERELYTSIYALRRLILLVMIGLAAIVVLVRLNLFDTVGMTLLASAGVLTVVLGVAGQQVLGNILASLQIAFAKPVRIGDSVLFEGEWAYVESIYYTYMRLRTWDHRRIVVPVKYFVSQPFENWSVREARMIRSTRLVLDHSADIDRLRRVFRDFAARDEGVSAPDNAFVFVTGHSSEGVEVHFYAESPDPSTAWHASGRLHENMLDYVRRNHPEWWPQERLRGDGRTVTHED